MIMGNKIKRTKLFELLKETKIYNRINGIRLRIMGIRYNRKEAEYMFSTDNPKHGNIDDYKKALNRHLVSYSEYMYQYEFWRLNDEERHKFISRLEMRLLYQRIFPWRMYKLFWNKALFLKYFSAFVHRKWIVASEVSLKEFENFVCSMECIAKPIEGSIGTGVFKIHKEIEDIPSLYNRCVKENLLIEECVANEDAIAKFHPNSLNTIRLTTVSGGILGSFIRFGRHGSVIDNAHAGGIFAQINPGNGIIESEGIDTYGHRFLAHPDTDVPILNFRIPRWNEIVLTCMEAHKLIPEVPIVGWDVCVDSKNNIEIIEGNHLPDVDVLQSPLKIGIRAKVQSMLNIK